MIFFVSDLTYTKHLTGTGHPEQPARTLVIEQALVQAGLKTASNSIKPRIATTEEVALCHTPDYIQLVHYEAQALEHPDELVSLSTGDVMISKLSFEIALLAVGGVLSAVDQVIPVEGTQAFCVVRPPGHHACSAQGMGFCLFNNVAIGARYAQQKYGVERVLIVDWDVHHGNGTQEIFYSDPTVFYFSTHEDGLYPGTGADNERGIGEGLEFTFNCPIRPGIQSRLQVIQSFERLQEQIETFQPDLIFISAGFDAHEADPLGHFNLTDSDFFQLASLMKNLANRYAKGRLISVLEGGYDLHALATASVAHVRGLIEQ